MKKGYATLRMSVLKEHNAELHLRIKQVNEERWGVQMLINGPTGTEWVWLESFEPAVFEGNVYKSIFAFKKLSDSDKWKECGTLKNVKWCCDRCGEDQDPPNDTYAGGSKHCGKCDNLLTSRTGRGRGNEFNWRPVLDADSNVEFGKGPMFDRFENEIKDGDLLFVDENSVTVYEKDSTLYFKPNGKEERVCDYFRTDLEIIK